MRRRLSLPTQGGSLRSPPAARLRALASLASSPAAANTTRTAVEGMEIDRLGVQRGQLVPLRNVAK
jgi:hypothetical protein